MAVAPDSNSGAATINRHAIITSIAGQVMWTFASSDAFSIRWKVRIVICFDRSSSDSRNGVPLAGRIDRQHDLVDVLVVQPPAHVPQGVWLRRPLLDRGPHAGQFRPDRVSLVLADRGRQSVPEPAPGLQHQAHQVEDERQPGRHFRPVPVRPLFDGSGDQFRHEVHEADGDHNCPGKAEQDPAEGRPRDRRRQPLELFDGQELGRRPAHWFGQLQMPLEPGRALRPGCGQVLRQPVHERFEPAVYRGPFAERPPPLPFGLGRQEPVAARGGDDAGQGETECPAGGGREPGRDEDEEGGVHVSIPPTFRRIDCPHRTLAYDSPATPISTT